MIHSLNDDVSEILNFILCILKLACTSEIVGGACVSDAIRRRNFTFLSFIFYGLENVLKWLGT